MHWRQQLMNLLAASLPTTIKSCRNTIDFRLPASRIGLRVSNPNRVAPSFQYHSLNKNARSLNSWALRYCYVPPYAKTSTTSCSAPHVLYSTSSPQEEERAYIIRFDSHIDTKTKDAGIGIVIYDSANGSKLWSGNRFISTMNNSKDEDAITRNVSDYMALMDGLRIARFLSSKTTDSSANTIAPSPLKVEIQTANDLIVKHLKGEYRVSSKNLKPWYEQITTQIREIGQVKTGKIDRGENKFVNKQAKMAIEEQKSNENYLQMMKNLAAPTSSSETMDLGEQNDEEIPAEPAEMPTSGMDHKELPAKPAEMPASEVEQSFTKAVQSSATMQTQPVKIQPNKVYILRFDGGSRGNPGNAGSGMVLYDSEDGSELWCGHKFIGKATNNEAEYMGLITGLQCALSLGIQNIVVQGDSQLVLRQVDGIYKVKSETLKPFHEEAASLKREFASFETSHIPRAENARADELANEAMDTQCSSGFEIAGE